MLRAMSIQNLVFAICAVAMLFGAAARDTSPNVEFGRALSQLTGPGFQLAHCALVKGPWCDNYLSQIPLDFKEVPRGDTPCLNNCSGVGVCQFDIGLCYCPAGFGGDDCSQPRKRPCWRMGEDKRDLDWHKYTEWTHSRCAGICDDDVAMCYCPPETKFGHISAPPGSPPGTPPIKQGRPLYWCQPSNDKDGVPVKWGAVSFEDLFGESGWCNSAQSKFQCPCRRDGMLGQYCNIQVEQVCINQCSGHGDCNHGFCHCHDGFYGHDCSRKRRGMPIELGQEVGDKPWLAASMTPVKALQNTPPLKRKRPLIYVYDLKPEYNTDIMQYRVERGFCTYREFTMGNRSQFVYYNAYAVESMLHELFLTTVHRTFDPEEADFFYVPTHSGCLFDVYGWNPIPMWPKGMHGPRPLGAANMIREAAFWINKTFPYFNRKGGKDHIWLMPHDEGACYAPKEIWPGIVMSHWGRLELNHTCGSGYHADNYSADYTHETFPGGWLAYTSKSHACFDPERHLVIPCFKQPEHYQKSPFLGAPKKTRDILLFFRGDIGRNRVDDKKCQYSRCIRQTLYNLSKSQEWKTKYNSLYGDNQDIQGHYGDFLSRSKFCLALPGDGWSARFEDGVLHGCIPVIIMDDVQVPFENILDITKFTVRVAQKDMPKLIELVSSIPEEKIAEMQASLNQVWQRYRWKGNTLSDENEIRILGDYKNDRGGSLPPNEGIQYAGRNEGSAFDTIINWLHSRIPHTNQ